MIKRILLGLLAVLAISSTAPAVQAAPATAPFSYMAQQGCPARLLTLPAWYRGLQGAGNCAPRIQRIDDIWIIALNIVEMMLHAVTYVAAGFIIWGGFRYMTGNAGGNSEKSAGAKGTIVSAVTGLAISVMAIAIINFVVDAAF